MPVKFEIKAKTGEKDGKAMYSKIGVVLQGDKGFSMKLNVLPLNWDGFAFFSEPEQRQGNPQSGQRGGNSGGYTRANNRQPPPDDFGDDDIPFIRRDDFVINDF